MAEKTSSTEKTNEELRRQRDHARRSLEKLPEVGGYDWKGLSREKRANVGLRRRTYQKVVARVDKLLGPDTARTPKTSPPTKGKSPTPGDKLIGRHIRKAAGLKPLMTTLQAAAKQGLKKKEKEKENQNKD